MIIDDRDPSVRDLTHKEVLRQAQRIDAVSLALLSHPPSISLVRPMLLVSMKGIQPKASTARLPVQTTRFKTSFPVYWKPSQKHSRPPPDEEARSFHRLEAAERQFPRVM